jgi:hypothetical protein
VPVESDAARPLTHSLGAKQRRQCAGNAIKHRARLLLFGLDRLPLVDNLLTCLCCGVSKDVWMAVYQLESKGATDIVQPERTSPSGDFADENDLKCQVAKFLLQLPEIATVDRVNDLACFLEYILSERTQVLLAIPRTTLRAQQLLHQLDKARKRLTPLCV